MKTIIDEINRASQIALIIHKDPDGDAVGSADALWLALNTIGKSSSIFCASEVDQRWDNIDLPPTNSSLDPNIDLYIILDCGDLRMTGFEAELVNIDKTKNIIYIDHHKTNDISKIAKLQLVDSNASSTAELVYILITELNINISPKIAHSLLTGIYTDTGGFRNNNTSPELFRIISELLQKGARVDRLASLLVAKKDYGVMKASGIIYDRLKISNKYNIAWSILTKNDLEDCSIKQTVGLTKLIDNVSDVVATLLLIESTEGIINGFIRTRNSEVNAGALAKLFAGGGHRHKSGFNLPGKVLNNNGKWSIVIE